MAEALSTSADVSAQTEQVSEAGKGLAPRLASRPPTADPTRHAPPSRQRPPASPRRAAVPVPATVPLLPQALRTGALTQQMDALEGQLKNQVPPACDCVQATCNATPVFGCCRRTPQPPVCPPRPRLPPQKQELLQLQSKPSPTTPPALQAGHRLHRLCVRKPSEATEDARSRRSRCCRQATSCLAHRPCAAPWSPLLLPLFVTHAPAAAQSCDSLSRTFLQSAVGVWSVDSKRCKWCVCPNNSQVWLHCFCWMVSPLGLLAP